MTELPKASFWHRLLASLLDTMIFITVSALFLHYAAVQPTLPQAVFALMLYVLLLVLNPLTYIQGILLTYYFGGTLGKLFSGLRVKNEHGKRLSLKRIAFRQTIGYQLSNLIFGLGYFSILKDPNRQAWHDKAIGSVVIVDRPLWPVGLMLCLGLGIVSSFILTNAIAAVTTGPLKDEAMGLFAEYQSSIDKLSFFF